MAVKDRTEINEEINVRIPDNQEQLISPDDLRYVLHDIADSYFNVPNPSIPQGTVTGAQNVGTGVGVFERMEGSLLQFRSIDHADEDNPIQIIYDSANHRILLKAPLPITLREPIIINSHPSSNTISLSGTEEIVVYTFEGSEELPYSLNYIQICVNGEEVPTDSNYMVLDTTNRQIKLKTGPTNIKYKLDVTDNVAIRYWR